MDANDNVTDIRIRSAAMRDLDTLTRFSLLLAAESEGLALHEPTVREGVSACLRDDERGIYLVAEREGQVVGQVLVTLEWSDWRNGWFWWIQSVYVKADQRRTGVYRALYAAVEERARQDPGVRGLRLYVDRGVTSAVATYLALGMEETRYKILKADFAPPPRER